MIVGGIGRQVPGIDGWWLASRLNVSRRREATQDIPQLSGGVRGAGCGYSDLSTEGRSRLTDQLLAEMWRLETLRNKRDKAGQRTEDKVG